MTVCYFPCRLVRVNVYERVRMRVCTFAWQEALIFFWTCACSVCQEMVALPQVQGPWETINRSVEIHPEKGIKQQAVYSATWLVFWLRQISSFPTMTLSLHGFTVETRVSDCEEKNGSFPELSFGSLNCNPHITSNRFFSSLWSAQACQRL